MADYGALLARMIAETRDDPARARQLVYELARLTLKRQLQQTPHDPATVREHLAALEAAIVATEDLAIRDASPSSDDPGAHETASTHTFGSGRHPPSVPPHAPPPHPGRRIAALVAAAVVPVALYAAFVPSAPPVPPAPLPMTAAVEPPRPEPAPTVAAPAPGSPPLPTVYGVYAYVDQRLVEVDQAATAPVDPRVRTVLQMTAPSRITLPDRDLSFLVFRRDLMTSAPEKVPIRIAARLTRMMSFDINGKAVTAPPPEDRWIIRDIGFEFRVRPVRDNPEMVWVQPDDPSFVLPAGRYVLLLNGTPYDFSVDGAVTAPAHCLESVATARGPTLFECKPK